MLDAQEPAEDIEGEAKCCVTTSYIYGFFVSVNPIKWTD
jgi:hypothetical protein